MTRDCVWRKTPDGLLMDLGDWSAQVDAYAGGWQWSVFDATGKDHHEASGTARAQWQAKSIAQYTLRWMSQDGRAK